MNPITNEEREHREAGVRLGKELLGPEWRTQKQWGTLIVDEPGRKIFARRDERGRMQIQVFTRCGQNLSRQTWKKANTGEHRVAVHDLALHLAGILLDHRIRESEQVVESSGASVPALTGRPLADPDAPGDSQTIEGDEVETSTPQAVEEYRAERLQEAIDERNRLMAERKA